MERKDILVAIFKKNIFVLLLNIFIFIIIFEVFSFMFTYFNLLPYKQRPNYSNQNSGKNWLTEEQIWGAWHKENYKDHHLKKCNDGEIAFNVTYQSNNIGARDSVNYDFTNQEKSIILLGDSMAEGYGIELENTFAKLLEDHFNKQVINLASSGNFGPLQFYLIYNKLGKKFNHDELIIFFLPKNDFSDNSYLLKSNFKNRYRPYYKLNNSLSYEIIYPEGAIPSNNFIKNENLYQKIKIFLSNYTYSANTLKTIKYLLVSKKSKNESRKVKDLYSESRGYYANNEYNVEGALYFIEKTLMDAKEIKNKVIIIIPDKWDIEGYYFKNKQYNNLLWYKKINSLRDKYNVKIIDLMHHVDIEKYKNYFFKCDAHWSKEGNFFAFETYVGR